MFILSNTLNLVTKPVIEDKYLSLMALEHSQNAYCSQTVLPIQPVRKGTAVIKARAIVLHLCLFNLNVAFSCMYKKGKVNCLP